MRQVRWTWPYIRAADGLGGGRQGEMEGVTTDYGNVGDKLSTIDCTSLYLDCCLMNFVEPGHCFGLLLQTVNYITSQHQRKTFEKCWNRGGWEVVVGSWCLGLPVAWRTTRPPHENLEHQNFSRLVSGMTWGLVLVAVAWWQWLGQTSSIYYSGKKFAKASCHDVTQKVFFFAPFFSDCLFYYPLYCLYYPLYCHSLPK